jgi:hypothetical protein
LEEEKVQRERKRAKGDEGEERKHLTISAALSRKIQQFLSSLGNVYMVDDRHIEGAALAAGSACMTDPGIWLGGVDVACGRKKGEEGGLDMDHRGSPQGAARQPGSVQGPPTTPRARCDSVDHHWGLA